MNALLIWKLLRMLLLIAGASYAVLAVFGPFIAARLLFHPDFATPATPSGARRLRAADGEEVTVFHLPQPSAEFTLWYFHGNAESLADVEPKLREFHEAGFAVFAVEYPGYGGTAGKPSEESIFAAARTARKYLREELKVPAARTLIAGHSLGGGPAVQMATEEKVGGLVLLSVFLSAYRVVVPWPRLPFDCFDNARKLPDVNCPVLVMHGEADGVISVRHGRKLAAAAREPKRALFVPGAGHNDLPQIAGKAYWDELSAFRALCSRSAAP